MLQHKNDQVEFYKKEMKKVESDLHLEDLFKKSI